MQVDQDSHERKSSYDAWGWDVASDTSSGKALNFAVVHSGSQPAGFIFIENLINMEDSVIERLILVVEDNLHQAELIEKALKNSPVRHQVIVVQDGLQAMNFLHQSGDFMDAPRPDLILLDLNLPEKDGHTVLAEIKADPKLRRIPIVVLTHSNHTEDIFKSYELQGNCYVIKSSDFDQLFAIVQRIEEFWLGIVTLPLE